jgi:nitronate monooxygenase
MILDQLDTPIVLAPMAGGPSTVDLAVAVSEAGGLGFLAAGYRTADALREQMQALRARTARPFGVNLFVPPTAPADPASYSGYVERLRGEGAELGEPRSDDDAWAAKLAVLLEAPPAVVSFVFGCPPTAAVAELHERGAEVWGTVTTPDEATQAEAAGVDGLVAQGLEAGGHRATFRDDEGGDPGGFGLLALLALLTARTELPLIAAGGIATGSAVAAALAAGARAVQVGSAFMRSPEAGTAAVHREALAGDAPTAITRAFSGKPARGIVNAFMREHEADAPRAYPEIHYVTSPMRAAARERGDADRVNLWAGQTHQLAGEMPAGELVRRLVADARAATEAAARRLS